MPEDPLGPEEFVFRRAHKSHLNVVGPNAFNRGLVTPNPNDTDGLSVFRETSGVSPEIIREAARKPDECYVVRIPVRLLNKFGLTVVPSDDPDGPDGHCIIPELNYSSYKDRANYSHWRKVQSDLIQLLDEDDIVSRPPAGGE